MTLALATARASLETRVQFCQKRGRGLRQAGPRPLRRRGPRAEDVEALEGELARVLRLQLLVELVLVRLAPHVRARLRGGGCMQTNLLS